MIDGHCHLMDIKEVDVDRYRELERIVNCGYDMKSSLAAIELKRKEPEFLYCVVGVSPQKCMEEKQVHEVEGVERLAYVNKNIIDAIGEIGLDFHWADTPEKRRWQRELFKRQIMLAEELHKPIAIHAREAVKECMHELRNFGRPVQFHFFSGTPEEAKEITDYGWCISIPPIKGKERGKAIACTDISHIIAETDAPFVGKTPLDVRDAITIIAKIKEVSFEEIEKVTTANVKRIFG